MTSSKAPTREDAVVNKQALETNLESIDFDITDKFCQLAALILTFGCWCWCMGPSHLYLGPEEARYTYKAWTGCLKYDSKRPYGELGSVDEVNYCGLFKGFKSDVIPSSAQDRGEVFPGWGCDGGLRDKIVHELKRRMRARGETGLVKRAEHQTENLLYIKQMVKAIADKLGCVVNAQDPDEVNNQNNMEMANRV